MKQTKRLLLLSLVAAMIMQHSAAVAAESRYDASSACKSRGQIIQISGLKYLCQKRYVPIGAPSTPSFVLVKISSVKIQKGPVVTASKYRGTRYPTFANIEYVLITNALVRTLKRFGQQ